jgi:20S proteasome alpha/beta subunit
MRMQHTQSTSDPTTAPRMYLPKVSNELSYVVKHQHVPNQLTVASRQPIVTGTSVLAIKYKDGIMMAADNLGMT